MLEITLTYTQEIYKVSDFGSLLGQISNGSIDVNKVLSVGATGAELDYILKRFDNLPKKSSDTSGGMYWFGDHAKFIIANLV